MFVFILDNHPSMSIEKGKQRSALDMSKAAIEAFLSVYSKHQIPGTTPVPMMLMESGIDKSCILSHITDPLQSFENEMKNYVGKSDANSTSSSMCKNNDHSKTVQNQIKDQEPPQTNFSYSISLAFSVLNKLRIKNCTDRFGFGRCPWALEPASIFLFTNGNHQNSQEFELFTKWKTLSEYVHEVYKWDHRVFLFVMFNQEEKSKCTVPSHLTNLCNITGGELSICKSLKEAYDSAKALSTRLLSSHQTVGVKFSIVDGNKGETIAGSGSSSTAARLSVKSPGEWPIPEQGWVDIRDPSGKLPIRDAIPLISVLKGNSPAVAMSKSLLQLAKDSDIHPDTYDLSINSGKSLELDKNEMYPVYVNASWKHHDSATTSEAALTASPPEPFGIMSTGSRPGSYQLTLLPFNYPKLLPLLKQVLDQLKTGKFLQDVNLLPWMSQWRVDIAAYVHSVPPYYYPSIQRLLKKLQIIKLAFPGNQQSILDYELHRKPSQRIKRAQNEAIADIASMDIVARDRWPKPTPNANAVALATSAHSQQNLLVGGASMAMPKVISDIHQAELLSVWEKMRRSIFGGGSGVTVRGLSVPGISGTGGRLTYLAPDAKDDWLQIACGGSNVPRETTRDMSNYFAVLARQECPRDPTLVDTPADEDSELCVLKRKLSPPNFGNRYGGKKAAKIGNEFEIEGIVSTNDNLFQTGPALPTEMGKILLAETANQAVHGFFMDTPAPYHDENYLQSNDSMDVSSDEESSSSKDGAQSNHVQSAVENSIYSRDNTTTIPRLGLPVKRAPRPHSLPFASISVSSSVDAAAGAAPAVVVPAGAGAATPVNVLAAAVASSEVESSSPAQSPSSVAELPQSPGGDEWVKHFSEKHQRPYWFSNKTGKSVWSDPTA